MTSSASTAKDVHNGSDTPPPAFDHLYGGIEKTLKAIVESVALLEKLNSDSQGIKNKLIKLAEEREKENEDLKRVLRNIFLLSIASLLFCSLGVLAACRIYVVK